MLLLGGGVHLPLYLKLIHRGHRVRVSWLGRCPRPLYFRKHSTHSIPATSSSLVLPHFIHVGTIVHRLSCLPRSVSGYSL